jgi:hypothetical protein
MTLTPWGTREQSRHRLDLLDAYYGWRPVFHCLPCLRGEHGRDNCQGIPCPCKCRPVLDGPFDGLGDPSAPDATDLGEVA